MTDDVYLSNTATRVIAERKASARPVQLAELVALIRSRGGEVTRDQLYAVACVLSHLVPGAQWRATVRETLTLHATVPPEQVDAWLSSTAARQVEEYIAAAERGEKKIYRKGRLVRATDPRRDYGVAGTHGVVRHHRG